ncbi:MAG: ISAzo13 family transposase, partial [Desulfococcaceae bacterium]
RCRGVPEKHWNGTKLTDAETMLKRAGSMTRKGIYPFVKINKKRYKKGISLTKAAMCSVEKFLLRTPFLAKWDILISPNEFV